MAMWRMILKARIGGAKQSRLKKDVAVSSKRNGSQPKQDSVGGDGGK